MLHSTNKKPVKIPAGQFFFWKTDIGAKHKSRANAETERSSPRDSRRIGPTGVFIG
jgi:hypothetical protein